MQFLQRREQQFALNLLSHYRFPEGPMKFSNNTFRGSVDSKVQFTRRFHWIEVHVFLIPEGMCVVNLHTKSCLFKTEQNLYNAYT